MRYPEICSAIEKRNVLQFIYDGYTRVIEPHAYGVNDAGHELLRAYQTSGGSESGNQIGWKMFRVDQMHSVHESGARFSGPRPKYRKNDSDMSRIYCQL